MPRETLTDRLAAALVSGLQVATPEGRLLPPGGMAAMKLVNSEEHMLTAITEGDTLTVYWSSGAAGEAPYALALTPRMAVRLAWFILAHWWFARLWCGVKPRVFAWAVHRLMLWKVRRGETHAA